MADAPDLGSYPELALSAQSNHKRVLSSLSGHPANRVVRVRPVATDSSAKVVQKSGAPDDGSSATESLLDRGLDSGLSSAFFQPLDEARRTRARRPHGRAETALHSAAARMTNDPARASRHRSGFGVDANTHFVPGPQMPGSAACLCPETAPAPTPTSAT